MKTFKWVKTLKRNYDILTSDFSLAEMEHLIKRDAPGLFEFYNRENSKNEKKRNSFVQALALIKNLFVAFILKLKPARRILYFASLYFIGAGFWTGQNMSLMIGFAIMNLLIAFELADKIMAKDELEIARNIQMQLLPDAPPSLPQYDISFFSEAAREVGGDFIDFIQNGDKTTTVIGDISGKGMGAAIHMVQVHTIIKSLKSVPGTREFLSQLNDRLDGVLPKSVFVTTSFFCLNGSNEADFFRSGHLPLFKYNAETGTCESIVPPGLGIGLTDTDIYEKSLENSSLSITPGDVFLLFTDGLVETMNRDNDEYGEERLMQVLCEHAEQSGVEIQEAILSSVASFRGNQTPHDDLTLVVIKRK